jgi:hypothetical protein
MHKDILVLIVTQVPIHETEADCTETRLTVGGICMLKILIVHVIGRSAVVGIRICWFTDTAFRRRWLVEKFVWIVCCKWWFTGKWGSSGWLYTGHSVIT